MPSQGVTNVANAIINKINNLISSHNNNSNAHQDIRESIPSATSELNNNSGFITSSSVPSASNTTPSADTTNGTAGTGTTWARSDHTHPKSNIYAKASHTHSQYLTSHQDITGKEDKSNKVTSLSSSSTDTEYPSAKAVFNLKEELDDKFENCMKNTDFYDMMDCINVNFNDLDNIYLLDTVFNISNYNGLPSKKSSVVNDILRNNAVSQIGLNKEFTPSTKYTLEFDYYTSVGNRNGFYFGADPSLEDGTPMDYSDTGLQVLVDISNTFVETFNGTSSPTRVYTHTSNLFTSGTHHIRIVRNNTNVTFYIDDVELYTYTNAKYNTIGLNKWGSEYNTISNIEMEIGG